MHVYLSLHGASVLTILLAHIAAGFRGLGFRVYNRRWGQLSLSPKDIAFVQPSAALREDGG